MSAAFGRMFKFLWIIMLAGLGLMAARPDVSGADNGSAREIPAFRGMPTHSPVGAPYPRHVNVAVSENPSVPDDFSHPSYPLASFSASSRAVLSRPTSAPQPSFPHHPTPAILQQPAEAPSMPTSPEYAQTPEPVQNQAADYVVTAYYLNVRAEPDKTAPILGLLERGERVIVVSRTDNGWLELEDGRFIHGAYAEPAEPESMPESDPDLAPVKSAGREVAIASASPSVRPEHAINKPDKLEESDGPAPLSKKVESSSGMTEEDIAKLLEGTELEGHGLEEAILGIEEEYGINALFTIAVMKLESGNGKSKLARDKNNLFGLNATGGSNSKAYSFETKSDSVYKFGSIIAKSYLAKGYSTIEKVGKKYCPANPKWPSLVESIMKRDHRKLAGAAV